jgi:hypothetical protein
MEGEEAELPEEDAPRGSGSRFFAAGVDDGDERDTGATLTYLLGDATTARRWLIRDLGHLSPGAKATTVPIPVRIGGSTDRHARQITWHDGTTAIATTLHCGGALEITAADTHTAQSILYNLLPSFDNAYATDR